MAKRYELESSKKILIYENNSFSESVLISILKEAKEKNLPKNALIKIICERTSEETENYKKEIPEYETYHNLEKLAIKYDLPTK